MDKETEDRLNDLEKRIKYQEDIHPNIDFTKAGFTHGITTNIPSIISSVIVSLSAVLILMSFMNKQTK
jgi:hypothetical protein